MISEEYYENVTRSHKIKGSTEALLSILRRDFFDKLSDEIEQLSQSDVPILIIWGKHDKAIAVAHGEALHRKLNGSRFEIIDGAGHVPNSEKPDVFNARVLKFLLEEGESRSSVTGNESLLQTACSLF